MAALLLAGCRPEALPVGMLYADPAVVDLAGALPTDTGMASRVVVANVGTHCVNVDTIALEGDSAALLSLATDPVPLVLVPSALTAIDVIPVSLPFLFGEPDAAVLVSGIVGDDVEGACVSPEDDPKPIELRIPILLATPDACDGDGDLALIPQCGGDDCDDADPLVHPGAEEVCNGKDDDCDEVTDGPTATDAVEWFLDEDGDLYGEALLSVIECEAPPGYVADATDCDDADPAVHPGASEVCDGVDQDCDAEIDEGFPRFDFHADADDDLYGDPLVLVRACVRPEGTVPNDDDCDDTDPLVHPGADEVCDDEDQDCDGVADDNAVDAPTWYRDVDGDLYGNPTTGLVTCDQPVGYVERSRDCDDNDPDINPAEPEICDGVDQDCDDAIDDDPTDGDSWFPDTDLDGFGDDALEEVACDPIPGSILVGGDCDDGNALINPNATETCDGVDQDCDGAIDQGDVCPCPVEQFGGHAYGFCDTATIWFGADAACSAAGYELVTIDDAAEDDFVATTSQSYATGPWWTGYTDTTTEGSWVWADGTAGTYDGWAPGRPLTSGGFLNFTDCMQIGGNSGWVDAQCLSSNPFVCESGP